MTLLDAPINRAVLLHLELHTARVTARILGLLDDALGRGLMAHDDVERRFPFLQAEADRLDALGGRRASRRPDRFETMAAEHAASLDDEVPLARVTRRYGDSLAADVLVIATLVDRDARLVPVVSALQGPDGPARPCAGLIATITGRSVDEAAAAIAAVAADGVVLVEDPSSMRVERAVSLPASVLQLLEGRSTPRVVATARSQLIASDALTDRLNRAAALVASGSIDALVLRGRDGTGRRTAMATIAARLVRPLVVAEPSEADAVAIALLSGAFLVWTVDPGPGEVVTVGGHDALGPVGVVTGERGAVRTEGADRTVVVDLPMPDADVRRELWAREGFAGDTLTVVTERFLVAGGTIREVAHRADALARLDDRDAATVDDVRAGLRDHSRRRLEALAELLPVLPDAALPVLAGGTASDVDALVLRCRHRERLAPSLGESAAGNIGRGVRALLSGPSGTGKTLTARALGEKLSLDVYRANLAAIVDKYIGETERKLDDLLTRSEELDVILLIDEGDALLTQRTDVRSSNDRYANLETDFLLQRLESFQGIVLITTNAPNLVDDAFRRRMDVAITFGVPGVSERLAMWRQHLPPTHTVDEDELHRIADACKLTGGQIRNATVHAALLALDDGRPVDGALLRSAVERELDLAGLTSPFGTRSAHVTAYEHARSA